MKRLFSRKAKRKQSRTPNGTNNRFCDEENFQSQNRWQSAGQLRDLRDFRDADFRQSRDAELIKRFNIEFFKIFISIKIRQKKILGKFER